MAGTVTKVYLYKNNLIADTTIINKVLAKLASKS